MLKEKIGRRRVSIPNKDHASRRFSFENFNSVSYIENTRVSEYNLFVILSC